MWSQSHGSNTVWSRFRILRCGPSGVVFTYNGSRSQLKRRRLKTSLLWTMPIWSWSFPRHSMPASTFSAVIFFTIVWTFLLKYCLFGSLLISFHSSLTSLLESLLMFTYWVIGWMTVTLCIHTTYIHIYYCSTPTGVLQNTVHSYEQVVIMRINFTILYMRFSVNRSRNFMVLGCLL